MTARHDKAAAALEAFDPPAAAHMVQLASRGRTTDVRALSDPDELDALAAIVGGMRDGSCHLHGPHFIVGAAVGCCG